MGQTEELFETIHFGFNSEDFFLRFDSMKKDVTFTLSDGEELVIYLHNKQKYKIRFYFDGKRYRAEYIGDPEEGYNVPNCMVNFAVKAVLEMGFKFKELGFKPNEKITVIVTVLRKGVEVRHYSHIHFTVPDDTYERQMWSV
jgi:hypothetical protein